MNSPSRKVRVLIVDDSAVVREVMTRALAGDPQIEVIGAAADPIFARQRMERDWPDVILLDVEMPRMDGISFLKQLMSERPTPVVICSTLTEKGAATTLAALSAGAVSFVTKPRLGLKDFLGTASREIATALKSAAATRPRARVVGSASPPAPDRVGTYPAGTVAGPRSTSSAALSRPDTPRPEATGAMLKTTHRVIAIGASTGGTQALESVLTRLPRALPGIVIVQHMPEKFTASLAERLDQICEINVREARTGDRVAPGVALIAPGGRHLTIRRSGAYYEACVMDGPLVNRHRPSVDVLFRSVAQIAGRNAVGMIMTGMGDDGARGLREMLDAGARTFAQDEASCVVYGMPKEAVRMGGVEDVLPLDRFPEAMVAAARACLV